MIKKTSALLFITLLSLFATSCGGGGSSSGGDGNRVNYSIDPVAGPTCNGEDDDSDEGDIVSCTWHCAVNNLTAGPNNGVEGFWVIYFTRSSNGTWGLHDEVVSIPCP